MDPNYPQPLPVPGRKLAIVDQAEMFADNLLGYVLSRYNLTWDKVHAYSERARDNFESTWSSAVDDILAEETSFFETLDTELSEHEKWSEEEFDHLARELWEDYLRIEFPVQNVISLLTSVVLLAVYFHRGGNVDAPYFAFDHISLYSKLVSEIHQKINQYLRSVAR